VTGLHGQLDALVDAARAGMRPDEAVKCAEAQGDANLRIEFGVGVGRSAWMRWSSLICQRSTPRTRAVARLRSGARAR